MFEPHSIAHSCPACARRQQLMLQLGALADHYRQQLAAIQKEKAPAMKPEPVKISAAAAA